VRASCPRSNAQERGRPARLLAGNASSAEPEANPLGGSGRTTWRGPTVGGVPHEVAAQVGGKRFSSVEFLYSSSWNHGSRGGVALRS